MWLHWIISPNSFSVHSCCVRGSDDSSVSKSPALCKLNFGCVSYLIRALRGTLSCGVDRSYNMHVDCHGAAPDKWLKGGLAVPAGGGGRITSCCKTCIIMLQRQNFSMTLSNCLMSFHPPNCSRKQRKWCGTMNNDVDHENVSCLRPHPPSVWQHMTAVVLSSDGRDTWLRELHVIPLQCDVVTGVAQKSLRRLKKDKSQSSFLFVLDHLDSSG